jgi:hypothetical protein
LVASDSANIVTLIAASAVTLTVPTGASNSGELVTLNGTQTLANKTWNGAIIGTSYGGTGVGSAGTTANRVFASNGTSATPSFRQIVAADISSEASTSGYVLTSNGSGVASWAAPTGGSGGGGLSYTSISSNTSVTDTGSDRLFECAGTINVQLPSAPTAGRVYNIKNTGTGVITILAATSPSQQYIDGLASYTIGIRYQSVTIASNGSGWVII